MMTHTPGAPTSVPLLSAGHHRSPRKGACFMEFASYLAGEKWSDHPACTHPALAFLARMINDCSSSSQRSRLAELIPSVIGLNGSDPRVEVMIALRSATMALPIASEERQRALAVGALSSLARLDELGFPADDPLRAEVETAFAQAPLAARWAKSFVAENRVATKHRAASRTAESVIRTGVLGIAQACAPDVDARLRDLLRLAIADCEALLGEPTGSVENRVPRAGTLQLKESVV